MTHIDKVQALLEAKLRELTARAVGIDDHLGEAGDDDWAEHAVESADDEVLEEVGGSTLEEIRQIKLALAQIKLGKYGICTECDGAIAERRLSALPQATKCAKCA